MDDPHTLSDAEEAALREKVPRAWSHIDEHHPGERERFEQVIERPDDDEQKRLKAAQARRESDPARRGECR